MIYLITGVPGAGKTLRAVELIDGWVREGRPVYARVDGLAIDGVRDAPDDWRDTPDGSVVVYDEAQQLFGAEGRSGRSARDEIQAMEVHRHTGHDLVLVTQHPGLIHAHVRRLVGRHEHVQRVFGTRRVIISWRDRAFDVDSRSERNSAATMQWSHPQRLFSSYRSASLHVDKARLPGRLKILAVFALFLMGVVVYSGWSLVQGPDQSDLIAQATGVGLDGSGESTTVLPAASSTADVDHLPAPPPQALPVVGGCIWTATRCQCYTRQGFPIDDEPGECFRRVEQPLNVVVGFDGGRSAPQREPREPAAQPAPVVVSSTYSGPDPVALSGRVNPVALSAGGAPAGVVQ